MRVIDDGPMSMWNGVSLILVAFTRDISSDSHEIVQLVERPTEKPGARPTRVRVPGAARDVSPGVIFQCRHSYGVRTAPRVQSLSSAAVRTLKIPNTGSHTVVRTHGNTAHTDRNG